MFSARRILLVVSGLGDEFFSSGATCSAACARWIWEGHCTRTGDEMHHTTVHDLHCRCLRLDEDHFSEFLPEHQIYIQKNVLHVDVESAERLLNRFFLRINILRFCVELKHGTEIRRVASLLVRRI